MYADSQESDVLGRARAGDERAFLALYRAAQPGLLRYLSVLVGDAAEEVAAGSVLKSLAAAGCWTIVVT